MLDEKYPQVLRLKADPESVNQKLKGLRVAVTGARGRYAPIVAEALTRKGASVKTFSQKEGGKHQGLAALLEPGVLAELDAILHFGWGTVPKVAEEKQGAEWQKDLPFISKLLQALGRLPEKQGPILVFPSTGAVYGECGNEPAIEATALAPKSYYAAGKVAAEELLHQYSAHGKGKVAILRISNLYGAPGVSKVPQGVIAKLAECFYKNTRPTIWGDGTATKDYLHVDDFCEGVYRVLAERLEGVWNLCTGTSHSLLEVLSIFSKHLKWNPDCAYLPHPSWDVEKTNLSSQKLITATHWFPKIELQQGIQEYLFTSAGGHRKGKRA
jgi:UDP-glucose 4-epimerase